MKKYLPLILILLIGTFFASNLLRPGLMHTHDGIWHIERLISMTKMLGEGQFPVRWSTGLDNGFGLPVFNFVYPAPYYLMSIFHLSGLGVVATLQLTTFLYYLVGGIGFYLLFAARSRLLGFTSALFYLSSPYLFLDIFVRGALGELAALSLVPWCLLVMRNLHDTGRLSWFTPLPLFLLLISHNFLGLIFLLIITFLTFILSEHKAKVLTSIAISLGLSAFFLLPMILERGLLLTSPPGLANTQFTSHYAYPSQLLYSPWNYTGSLPGNNPGEISYQLGFANILVLLLGVILLFSKRVEKSKKKLSLYLLISLVSIFLTMPVSDFFWQAIPLLQIIQFPWRLIAIVMIMTPLIAVELIGMQRAKRSRQVFAIFISALAVSGVLTYRKPERVLTDSEFASLHATYSEKFASAYRYELTPKWAQEERSRPDLFTISSGTAELTDIDSQDTLLSFRADASSDSALTVYYNYYPSWSAIVDGQPLTLEPASDGSILLPLTEGQHDYVLRVASTEVAKLANTISLASILILLLVAYRQTRSRDQQ